MESKLTLVVWGLLGLSIIPALQVISLTLAITISCGTILIGYPKFKKAVDDIIKQWKHLKKD